MIRIAFLHPVCSIYIKFQIQELTWNLKLNLNSGIESKIQKTKWCTTMFYCKGHFTLHRQTATNTDYNMTLFRHSTTRQMLIEHVR